MILWLKADVGVFSDAARTTPQTTNGGAVKGWADQSGTGNHASSALSTSTLLTSATNSKPGVAMTSDYWTFANPPSLITGFDYFLVAQVQTGGACRAICFANGSNTASYTYLHPNFAEVNFGPNNTRGADLTRTGAIGSGYVLVEYWFNTSTINAAKYVSGSSTTSVTANVANSTFTPNSFGNWAGNAGLETQANVCEIVAYSRALTSGERTTVTSYLATKYAV